MRSQPSPAPAPAFTPRPAQGRVFTAARAVRSTEVAPDGRLRFDTLARYLQEVAEDDVTDSGWQQPYVWLMRRVTVRIARLPGPGRPADAGHVLLGHRAALGRADHHREQVRR